MVSLLPNWSSYGYFFSNFPYVITKWLKIYSDKEFQFSDSVFLFITLLKVLYAFAFLFLVEELFLSFLIRRVWPSQVALEVQTQLPVQEM